MIVRSFFSAFQVFVIFFGVIFEMHGGEFRHAIFFVLALFSVAIVLAAGAIIEDILVRVIAMRDVIALFVSMRFGNFFCRRILSGRRIRFVLGCEFFVAEYGSAGLDGLEFFFGPAARPRPAARRSSA